MGDAWQWDVTGAQVLYLANLFLNQDKVHTGGERYMGVMTGGNGGWHVYGGEMKWSRLHLCMLTTSGGDGGWQVHGGERVAGAVWGQCPLHRPPGTRPDGHVAGTQEPQRRAHHGETASSAHTSLVLEHHKPKHIVFWGFCFVLFFTCFLLLCCVQGEGHSEGSKLHHSMNVCSDNILWTVYPVMGIGDSSVVRAPDSWSKGRGFESLQERRENFLLQGQLFVLIPISVSVPPPCYRSST